jgi:adenylate cyclase
MNQTDCAVLFADLDGYTALTEAHGDLDAAEVAIRFADTARQLLSGDARLIKSLGDAVLIVTTDPADAIEIGRQLIEVVDRIDRYPSVGAGVHAGPVVERDGDVFGSTVNLAARAAAHAAPRQLLCTDAVAQRLDDTGRASLRALGTVDFANVPEPVALYELADLACRPRVVDPVCRMQLDPRDAAGWVRQGDWHFCSLECLQAFLRGPDRYLPRG